jgi:hypothetical protein
MALFLALTLFQHLIDGFHNRDLRNLVADLLGVTASEYTTSQMTYDLAPTPAQRHDLPAAADQSLLRHTVWLESSPGCSRGLKVAYSGPPLPCSPATTPSYLSLCAHPWIASTTNWTT